jgi:hypothetical protein
VKTVRGGTIYYGVGLRNDADRSCVTGGYPGISAYSPAGDRLPLRAARQPGATPALTVAAGHSVYFTLGLSDGADLPSGTCATTVGALHIIAPDDTASFAVATPLQGGKDPVACSGRAEVSPLIAGALPPG